VIEKRWVDLFTKNIMQNKSADEIAAEVVARAGLRQKGGD
jgi:hypothetical protein